MIFVTVGTHEQPFNRLVECIDNLKLNGNINEAVVIQTGFSTYEPKGCEWSSLYPFHQMQKYVDEARVVITHGGPSSFIMPLQIGKIPVVVPRKKEFNEHVNDHQVNFCRTVVERQGNIIVVENIEILADVIERYDDLVKAMPAGMKSNNEQFCMRLEEIANKIVVGIRK